MSWKCLANFCRNQARTSRTFACSKPRAGLDTQLQHRIRSNGCWARQSHSHTHSQVKTKETQLLGNEPPLYDGKPRWWAQWAWGLLVIDIIFTTLSWTVYSDYIYHSAAGVDMAMNYWTQPVSNVDSTSTADQKQDAEEDINEDGYEMRPLWQRFGLATAQVAAGAVAGGFIMASRDRTVWRMRILRLATSSNRPSHSNIPFKSTSPSSKLSHASSASHYGPPVLSLETGSGRTKRFFMRDCELAPGRDLTELILRIRGVRIHFWIGLNGAKVLGLREGEFRVKGEPERSAEEIARDVSTGGKGQLDEKAVKQLGEMRAAITRAWIAAEGSVFQPQKLERTSSTGWTSGPVVR